jgi:environmental stress-induced protein Ves
MPVRLTRLDPQSYRRTPWKNGGGVTIDIADAYGPGVERGSWDGMLWRFGRTQILQPGPFSDLSGYERILTVIGGRGLMLEVADGAALDARTPLMPVRFPGEARITSRLEAGPVEVLNLMADRARTIDVAILADAGTRPLAGGVHLLYALTDPATLEIGGEALSLSADHALRIDGAAGFTLAHGAGTLVLASIIPG